MGWLGSRRFWLAESVFHQEVACTNARPPSPGFRSSTCRSESRDGKASNASQALDASLWMRLTSQRPPPTPIRRRLVPQQHLGNRKPR